MMRFFLGIGVLVAIAATGFACGSDDDQDPEVTCPSPPPTFTEVAAFDVCVNCHSSTKTTPAERQDAKPGVNFDIYESAKQNAALAVHQVEEGHMPPRDSGFTLTADQKVRLIQWAECGTLQ